MIVEIKIEEEKDKKVRMRVVKKKKIGQFSSRSKSVLEYFPFLWF